MNGLALRVPFPNTFHIYLGTRNFTNDNKSDVLNRFEKVDTGTKSILKKEIIIHAG
jgi:hypothetical protein